MIIDASIATQWIWGWTSESLHAILGIRTFCKPKHKYNHKLFSGRFTIKVSALLFATTDTKLLRQTSIQYVCIKRQVTLITDFCRAQTIFRPFRVQAPINLTSCTNDTTGLWTYPKVRTIIEIKFMHVFDLRGLISPCVVYNNRERRSDMREVTILRMQKGSLLTMRRQQEAALVRYVYACPSCSI